ncbi:hypothetical protein Tco_1364026, partial [Tanacetum coccineum]
MIGAIRCDQKKRWNKSSMAATVLNVFLYREIDIVPLSYHIVDDFEIQFRREEFCLVTVLKFGVDYSVDYKNEDDPIPFRRRKMGRLPTTRLTPDKTGVVSDWWVSSRAYFDGCISEAARIPRHVNRQNLSDVPSEFYQEFEEQKRVVDQMMKKDAEREEMYDQMRKFMHDMNVGPV